MDAFPLMLVCQAAGSLFGCALALWLFSRR